MSKSLASNQTRYGVALKAGAIYFGAVFSVGFVLGTMRALLFLPFLGETASVALEVPFILAVSWITSRASIKKFEVPNDVLPRLLMGVMAFVLLILAELALSVLIFGRTIEAHSASYWTPEGLIGLAAQIAFAVFPLLQRTRK